MLISESWRLKVERGMNPKQLHGAYVDDEGRLVLPPGIRQKFGLKPGTRLQVEESLNEFHILRPVSHLAKVYIEPTNICPLDCRTCMRNVWDEPMGKMGRATFEGIVQSLKQLPTPPTVFFQGFGEPLAHARIGTMIRAMKAIGARVELITNAVLLSEAKAYELIRAGLDMLWVSIDGASPESYADVRLGASLPKVIANLERLLDCRIKAGYRHEPKPQLGFAFVAMKRNIADLPKVLSLGVQLGVKRFSISNVIAHTDEMRDEILYHGSIHHHDTLKATYSPIINLPRMDTNSLTQLSLSEVRNQRYVLLLAGKETNRALDSCQFIEQGSTAIRWDGGVSPCPPLLHSHVSFIEKRRRQTHSFTIGNVNETDLLDLWNRSDYQGLRERIQRFDFSPCVACNGCEISRENQEDCLANLAPTCGGCLWGQGLIQCP